MGVQIIFENILDFLVWIIVKCKYFRVFLKTFVSNGNFSQSLLTNFMRRKLCCHITHCRVKMEKIVQYIKQKIFFCDIFSNGMVPKVNSSKASLNCIYFRILIYIIIITIVAHMFQVCTNSINRHSFIKKCLLRDTWNST